MSKRFCRWSNGCSNVSGYERLRWWPIVEWSARRPWKPSSKVIRRCATLSGSGCEDKRRLALRSFGSRAGWFGSVPERCHAKDPSPLKVKEVWVEKRRYVVCLKEERRKDAHDREAIVGHLKEQLRRGDKSLVGNKGYRRYLKVQGESHFALDEKRSLTGTLESKDPVNLAPVKSQPVSVQSSECKTGHGWVVESHRSRGHPKYLGRECRKMRVVTRTSLGYDRK